MPTTGTGRSRPGLRRKVPLSPPGTDTLKDKEVKIFTGRVRHPGLSVVPELLSPGPSRLYPPTQGTQDSGCLLLVLVPDAKTFYIFPTLTT